MMAIGLLLPFILIVFITLLVVRAGSGASGKFIQGRNLKRVLAAYLIILLASLIALYFLHHDEMSQVDKERSHEVSEIHDRFFNSLHVEKKADLRGLELREEFEKETTSDVLTIAHANEEFYRTVIIEKNKSLSDEIIGEVYVLPALVEDLEVTHAMPTLPVAFSNDRIVIGDPAGHTEVSLRLFEKEFTINQFTEDGWFSDSLINTMNVFGDSYLYLQIPDDMEIVTESESIELIFVK